jgi:hypothetical protein
MWLSEMAAKSGRKSRAAGADIGSVTIGGDNGGGAHGRGAEGAGPSIPRGLCLAAPGRATAFWC